MIDTQKDLQRQNWRTRCYGCHRPIDRCFCHRIPEIENKTEVVILQHKRERLHPFNTARIVRRSLKKSQLFVDHTSQLAEVFSRLSLSPMVGLLYPGEDSCILDNLPDDQRPDQLIVLDGTWHHTKTLFRDIPRLRTLPKYRLAPIYPSQYIIRREPDVDFLSTLEATVAALKCLEPETLGLDELVNSFVEMIQSQLSLPQADFGSRRRHHRQSCSIKNIPKAIRQSLERVVVVYGETAPGFVKTGFVKTGVDKAGVDKISQEHPKPVYWVAERLVSSERFEQPICSDSVLSESFLKHLMLPANVFEKAMSFEEFRKEWEAFLQPNDIVAFYYPNVSKLLSGIGDQTHGTMHLKSVQIGESPKGESLEQLLMRLNVTGKQAVCSGRAGRRLANSIAFAHFLNGYSRQNSMS